MYTIKPKESGRALDDGLHNRSLIKLFVGGVPLGPLLWFNLNINGA